MKTSSDAVKPCVRVGTKFKAGVVAAIFNDYVSIETPQGVKRFTFSQVEGFINEARSLSQA